MAIIKVSLQGLCLTFFGRTERTLRSYCVTFMVQRNSVQSCEIGSAFSDDSEMHEGTIGARSRVKIILRGNFYLVASDHRSPGSL